MAYPSSFSSSATSAEVDAGVPRSTLKSEAGASSADHHSDQVIAGLRTSIGKGDWTSEIMLQRIAEAAQALTHADGAAIALRQEDVVICKARAGDLAPDLGASLDADSGISGECLRTATALRCEDTNDDKRVDAEVCRRLGLRSLAVVPLGTKAPASGILETFSSMPDSFPERDLELLQELAELVIAAQRRSAEGDTQAARDLAASITAAHLSIQSEKRVGLYQRLHGFGQKIAVLFQLMAQNRLGLRKVAVLSVSAVVLLVGLNWLVFKGNARLTSSPERKREAVVRPPQGLAPRPSAALAWTARPAPSSAENSPKAAPASPVVLASKAGKIRGAKDVFVRNLPPGPPSDTPAADNATVKPATSSVDRSGSASESPPVLASTSARLGDPLGNVLASPVNLPQPAIRVSEGLTQGVLVRRVQPIYPAQARTLRLEGSVVMQALVAEDGTVHNLSIVSGHPLLARAASSAVRQWRYSPFRLNGKPIAMRTEIKVDFKLPAE